VAATYHVLLIGIDAYFGKPLHGCVNDIDAVQQLLLERVHVPKERITRLASPHPGTRHATTISGSPATLDNIRAALAGLAAPEVESSHRVFIYYSGHGARVSVAGGASRFDREALVPVDYDAQLELDMLFDFELNRALGDIAERTRNVTLVLDCCHSAAATREAVAGPQRISRAIDVERVLRRAGRDTATATRGGDFATEPRGVRGSVDQCHVVSACLNHELAQEDVNADGVPHGLLTSALLRELALVGDAELPSVPWSHMWQAMRARVETQNPTQHPWMAGNEGRAWLAGPPVEGDAGLPIRGGDAHTYAIGAGTLAGITPGARLAVYGETPAFFPPLGSAEDDRARRDPFLVEVTSVSRATSVARAVGQPGATEHTAIERGFRARLVQAGAAERIRCYVEPWDRNTAAPDFSAVLSGVLASQLIEVVDDPSQALVCLVRRDGAWALTDDVHGNQPGFPPLLTVEVADLRHARAVLEHYVRYATPLRMATRSLDLPGQLELGVLAIPAAGLPEGEAQDPSVPEAPAHPALSYGLKVGETIAFRVRNAAARRLRVTLFDCAASGKVQVLGDQIVDPASHHVFWARSALGKPFVMKAAAGSERYIDRLVAIGTTAIESDIKHLRSDRGFADVLTALRGARGTSRDIGDDDEPPAAPAEQWTGVMKTVGVGL
jgi:hypothetical protein